MKFEKLHQLRTGEGLTHAEMAKKLNISKAYYCQIENRVRKLSYNMAYHIAKLFGCKPDMIFYDEADVIKEK